MRQFDQPITFSGRAGPARPISVASATNRLLWYRLPSALVSRTPRTTASAGACVQRHLGHGAAAGDQELAGVIWVHRPRLEAPGPGSAAPAAPLRNVVSGSYFVV